MTKRDISLRLAVENAEKAAADLRQFGKRGQKALDDLTKGAERTTSSFKLAKNSTQQLGFQLQDTAVQLQGGTSPFVVLGQQGSQLAAVLGPSGALLGAFIAFGSLAAGALFGVTKEAKDLSDVLDTTLADGFFNSASAADRYIDALSRATKEQQKFIQLAARADIAQTISQSREDIEGLDLSGISNNLAKDARVGNLPVLPGGTVQNVFPKLAASIETDIKSRLEAAVKAGDAAEVQRIAESAGLLEDPAAIITISALATKANEVQAAQALANLDKGKLTQLAAQSPANADKSAKAAAKQRDKAENLVSGLRQQIVAQEGLAVALGQGADAVEAFNLAQQIYEAQSKAGVDADSKRGQEIAKLVTELDKQTKAADEARLAQERLAKVEDDRNRAQFDRGFDPTKSAADFNRLEKQRERELAQKAKEIERQQEIFATSYTKSKEDILKTALARALAS